MPPFALQFPASEIPALAARFPALEDGATHRLGAAARARGHYTRSEFLLVCSWKSPRSRPKVQANSARAVRAATSVALSPASSEQTRIEALLALQGVGVPTASTLLYMAFPAEYPILDVRRCTRSARNRAAPTRRATGSRTSTRAARSPRSTASRCARSTRRCGSGRRSSRPQWTCTVVPQGADASLAYARRAVR